MIGHELGRRYEILSRIGGGGMALVYKAHDILLNRKVAVKVLRQQFVHDEEFIQRFRREAQSAAALSHPNVVSIYDVGQEGETHYIVMEYIEGRNLNEIIKEFAPLQVKEAVGIAAQICDALDHAHHNHIIHRDIKPHNILIGNNGRVKVTDFGIARAVTSSTITHTGSVVGSVHYFSPEHAKGINTGEKSDLYSLGIVLYQMLTAQLPFLGESPISVALKHLQENFAEPKAINPHIPQSVENVILKAMRKNPSERYASADEMMSDLETCLLPERLLEPKLTFHAVNDLDETIIMPAIRGENSSAVTAASTSTGKLPGVNAKQNTTRLDDYPPLEYTAAMPAAEQTGRMSKKWKKPLAVVGVTLFILSLIVAGFIWILDRFNVDDVEVPYVVNRPIGEAEALLKQAKLRVEYPLVREFNKDVPKDVVIDQSKKNTKAKEGSYIQLHVSDGPEMKELKNYVGQPIQSAVDELTGIGMREKDQILIKESFSEEAPNTILEQSLPEKEMIDPTEAVITFTISIGRETVVMPELVDMNLKTAHNLLQSLELVLKEEDIIYVESYLVEKGKIISQDNHQPGDKVPKGSSVIIRVSTGIPADSKNYHFTVVISPAKVGQASEVKIAYSDARGENVETVSRVITTTETIPVTVVLAPDTVARVSITRDKQLIDIKQIYYEELTQGSNSGTVTIPGEEEEHVPEEKPTEQSDDPPNGNEPNNDQESEQLNEEHGNEQEG